MNATTKTPTLKTLRAESSTRQIRVYSQGAQWIRSIWNETQGAWVESPMPAHTNGMTERQALATVLGYDA